MKKIDLTLLPKVEHGHAWFSLNSAITGRLRILKRASERIENSIKFMWFSHSNHDMLRCAADDAGRLREGFLRAALAELVSVEEVLPLDTDEIGRPGSVLRMNDSPLPHMHLVRELRNHELHLYHNRLSGFSRNLMWGDMAQPEAATPLEVGFFTLDGITPASVSELRNAKKHYSAHEIQKMVEWFNDTQAEWGVHEILLRTANTYAEALCDEYVPVVP